MKSELQKKWLRMFIRVENFDLLKSRSRLFRNSLAGDTYINADYHVNFFINELSPFCRDYTTYINRLIIKDLGGLFDGDNARTVCDFVRGYPLTHLIVLLNYYGCDFLLEQLVHVIAETPESVTKVLEELTEFSKNSESIKTFVERVIIYQLQEMKLDY